MSGWGRTMHSPTSGSGHRSVRLSHPSKFPRIGLVRSSFFIHFFGLYGSPFFPRRYVWVVTFIFFATSAIFRQTPSAIFATSRLALRLSKQVCCHSVCAALAPKALWPASGQWACEGASRLQTNRKATQTQNTVCIYINTVLNYINKVLNYIFQVCIYIIQVLNLNWEWAWTSLDGEMAG